MAKQKCTDLRDNPRLFMPKPRPQAEECLMEAKKEMYMNATREFIQKNCLKDGTQREGGLSEEYNQGLEELEA